MSDKKRSRNLKKNLIKKTRKIQASIQGFKDKAATTEIVTNAEWNKLVSGTRKDYKDLRVLWTVYLNKDIPLSYRIAARDVIDKARRSVSKSIKRSIKNFDKVLSKRIHLNTMKSLTLDSQTIAIGAIVEGEKMVVSLMKKTQVQLIATQAIAVGEKVSIRTIQNRILNSLRGELLEPWIIKAGSKRFTAEYYAEMIARTETRVAQSQGTVNTAIDVGSDLVQVSSHNTTTPVCLPFEGKIFSISGRDPDFPPLTEQPPFHPNCLHSISVTFRSTLERRGIQQYIDFAKGKSEVHPTFKGHIPIGDRKKEIKKRRRKIG